MNENGSVIEVQNLTISYFRKPALKGINLSIPKGKIVGIIGPNGAGKSTLLKGMLGLLQADSGKVLISGKEVSENLKKISYIPQKESFDWDFPVTVFDVVMMGRYTHLGLFQRPREIDKTAVMDALKKVEMERFSKRQIRFLSGGQQQRVFLARSLAQEAEILFLDEPFVGVDAATEKAIFTLMKRLKDEGKTILVVHHDLGKVTDYFDYVVLINQRLIAFGETEETFTPELLQRTYGGRLTILQKSDNLLRDGNYGMDR
jgi:manganese/zinc/iron transport system ATP- binding protein